MNLPQLPKDRLEWMERELGIVYHYCSRPGDGQARYVFSTGMLIGYDAALRYVNEQSKGMGSEAQAEDAPDHEGA